MKTTDLKELMPTNKADIQGHGIIEFYTLEQVVEILRLLGVSQRAFTSTCEEVENMAIEIDQFINQHALAKPMTYSRKLRQYLANKLNEYVG